MVDDDSFLLRGVIVKAGRPSFEGFEREGKGILARGESSAIVNHHLLFSKHVSCFKILHFIVPILGCLDEPRTKVIFFIVLALAT